MNDIPFEQFYKNLGLEEYPFSRFNAENEQDKQKDLFIRPAYYGPIAENFQGGASMFLIGERGTGKTAVTYDLIRAAEDRNIVVIVDDFSKISPGYQSVELYRLLISKIADRLFEKIFQNKKIIRKIDTPKRLLLSYIYQEFTVPTTRGELARRLAELQIPLWKNILHKIYSCIRYPLNYATTTMINVGGDALAKALGNISLEIKEAEVKEYFPDIPLRSDDTFNSIDASFHLLKRIGKLVQDLGLGRVIVVLDKLDEDRRLEGDSEKIAAFIRGFANEASLYSAKNIQVIVSIWSVPYRILQKENLRTQKLNAEHITWNRDDLEGVLNRRLYVFSNNKIKSVGSLLDANVSSDVKERIYELANGNPRDLWHAMNAVLRKQFELDSSARNICAEAIEDGLQSFVQKFNYYEYYPRKANARANSLDIYAYIRHLLKVGSSDFTRNQLTEKAGVSGGSANNYVGDMENIGLISSRDRVGASILYSIRDPKIRYAITNGLEIALDVR